MKIAGIQLTGQVAGDRRTLLQMRVHDLARARRSAERAAGAWLGLRARLVSLYESARRVLTRGPQW